jgi:putative flippase GtrA
MNNNANHIRLREMVLYVVFGAGTTLINLIAYWLFNNLWGEHLYLVSNVAAWVFSVAFAYITNKIWVFESHSWARGLVVKEALEFTGARLLSFIIEEIGLYLLIDIGTMGIQTYRIFFIELKGESLAKLLVSIIVIILNYLFSKFIIFKKPDSQGQNQ